MAWVQAEALDLQALQGILQNQAPCCHMSWVAEVCTILSHFTIEPRYASTLALHDKALPVQS